ncbi:VRR-NUC domain-containing protein [Pseudomonas argentinensis]|uniref:phosphodiesterase I n=1 Tax=Phytopseudomonas argentinensis TaxID=289370 RepID=A0A1I3KGR4_9GAMM|nr:VRR-NUC domain-containing protein [Pseudomonas argentinensis]KAB0550608.1 VRR-NUC domain-containing protein [Pseudomonas argentinensis]SFI71530.1 VRR-NUC domain-containing protein [Pseudomonas argentinensis]
MSSTIDPRFYYLHNFRKALAWIGERHADLLDDRERAFLQAFDALEWSAQALLVRMIMRKGTHFRASKLSYEEIGCCRRAAVALIANGWVREDAPLPLDELLSLLRKDEIVASFAGQLSDRRARKSDLAQQLAVHFTANQSFIAWCPTLEDALYSLTLADLSERLRLMFFGNLRQEWSEFVLADLGIFRYERVDFPADSRALRCREDVDDYLHLQRCREAFEAGEVSDELLACIDARRYDNPYIAERRAKLLFRIGQQLERCANFELALQVYASSGYGAARQRCIRVLERTLQHREAFELASQAVAEPLSDGELQLAERALVRLSRHLGLPAQKRGKAQAPARLDLQLPKTPMLAVERLVQQHLQCSDAPVHYVENTLICGLFGLLCWPAIFAAVPGAFFHPFQHGPADLLTAEFYARRRALFADCLAQLDDDRYRDSIRQTYRDKFGIQSPFVHWGVLSETLLEQALDCLPAAHLQAWFRRLLGDIQANRSGMPDLIQFWPEEKRYRMIEVKGPGDRLQDNQRRWLAFCAEHGMPVDVCYVQWAEA